jgi:chemotaxis protein methyltransferase WspC
MSDFEIEALLQKAMGLKVTSIGKSTLDRSVQKRMTALSIKDKNAYLYQLQTSALELRELIEEVVIPETWFFRDNEPFKALTKFLVTQWAQKHKNNLFRILSLPCSTGEEPYTLSMTLLDSGWPADKFTIHGVDISHRSIAIAKKGVYSENSFRGKDLSYRTKFFKKNKTSFILNKNVRDKVHFHTGNVLNRSFIEGLGMFDVIFFRNVMIYFDALSRQHAIATLYKILSDDGILFVGHAEAYTHAFAFHKKPEPRLKVDATKATSSQKPPQKSKKKFIKRFFPFDKRSKKNEPDLKVARKLADEGELQKATEICEEYLDQCGPSAHAFFLLGIIRDAANDTDLAEKLFRKALYLDPNHEESLIFLSLLAEKTGDIAEAKNLKLRIARLKSSAALQSSNS